MTPAGEKRNPYAWCPFSAGNRICMGRGLADITIRYMVTWMTEFFEMSHKQPEDFKNHHPRAFVYMPPTPGIPLLIKRRDGIKYDKLS